MAEPDPAQPKAILRGHKSQVHAACFARHNERLITGDADGFVAAWDMAIMRPRAVWQAHTNAILGIADWPAERIITHGRDNRLIVWKLGAGDEGSLSKRLPLDEAPEARPQPWMLHLLEVNTMNFCSFSWCPASPALPSPPTEVLIAVPNTLASEAIDIFHLPSQQRQHTVRLGGKHGMVMALMVFYRANSKALSIIAGYEDGLATVAQLDTQGDWNVIYRAQSHTQPILSLDIDIGQRYFLTSGADAIVAKHPIPGDDSGSSSESQALQESSGDDTLRSSSRSAEPIKSVSLLSQALASLPAQERRVTGTKRPTMTQTEPIKLVNTKHSGQQSLRVRSDGRIFVTAGWDSRVRVYSTKTMKELAVLKWHQVGCYAAAFSNLAEPSSESPHITAAAEERGETQDATDQLKTGAGTLVPKLVDMTVRDKRLAEAKTAHWLAVGSKDGKVSLWDIY